MADRRKFLKRAGYTTLSTLLAMRFLEKDKQKEGHSTNVAMARSSTNVNSPLRQLAAAKGKRYGVAIDSVSLQQDAGYAALIARECSIATPNGELKWNATGFSSVLKRLNNLGVKPVITELDIIIDFPLPSTIQKLDQMVADSYKRYLDLCFAANVDTVITWGITDKYSWIRDPNYMPAKFKANPSAQQFLRPLPYDQNLQPKLARNAIAQAFQ